MIENLPGTISRLAATKQLSDHAWRRAADEGEMALRRPVEATPLFESPSEPPMASVVGGIDAHA